MLQLGLTVYALTPSVVSPAPGRSAHPLTPTHLPKISQSLENAVSRHLDLGSVSLHVDEQAAPLISDKALIASRPALADAVTLVSGAAVSGVALVLLRQNAGALRAILGGLGTALGAVGTGYSMWAKTMPYACAAWTSMAKAVASDLFAQRVVERGARTDWRRTLAFVTFGGLYLGLFCQFKYKFLYGFLFGEARTAAIVAAKLAMDMVISAPLVYFPAYYLVKGALFGPSPRGSLANYFLRDWRKMLPKYWTVWLPTLSLMWTTVPAHMRVPFICLVSLAWQVALSTLTYRTASPAEAAEHAAAALPQPADTVEDASDAPRTPLRARHAGRARPVLPAAGTYAPLQHAGPGYRDVVMHEQPWARSAEEREQGREARCTGSDSATLGWEELMTHRPI